jgi:type IV pilus assembly protein PilA
MSFQTLKRRNLRGFTLVELLIVVAIIGVLSTIGVPTFRRMIQKSKKSEAKVNLGGVYTSESAFYAEYNAYGNNLAKMGFQIDGAASTLIYSVGFYDATCSETLGTAANIYPTSAANNAYTALNASFPAYFATANSGGKFGATISTTCVARNSINDGSGFTAGAEGIISPTINAPNDRWTIDSSRTVANTQDGVL